MPPYDEIDDRDVAEKLVSISRVLDNSRKTHVFCQRAVQDLVGANVRCDGKFGPETADAINFAIESGLSKQFMMTVSHYAANYVQSRVSRRNYQKYLKELFS